MAESGKTAPNLTHFEFHIERSIGVWRQSYRKPRCDGANNPLMIQAVFAHQNTL